MSLIRLAQISVWGTNDGGSGHVDVRTCRESRGCRTHQTILDRAVSKVTLLQRYMKEGSLLID